MMYRSGRTAKCLRLNPKPLIYQQTIEIDIWGLGNDDKVLIRDHCGQISSVLLRTTTEALIRFKTVTDHRQVEEYIPACAATGSGSIEIIKHLTVICEQCTDNNLQALTSAHRNKLKEVVKRLVESVKVAKLQYPALVAHNDMVANRNELISSILESPLTTSGIRGKITLAENYVQTWCRRSWDVLQTRRIPDVMVWDVIG
eukprot:sb/3470670/